MLRYLPFGFIVIGFAICLVVGWEIGALLMLPLLLVGIRDLIQSANSLLRNYPVIGHIRFLAEDIRPQIQQYFVESDTEGKPFDRVQRSLVYERALNSADVLPFGTERDVKAVGYESLNIACADRVPRSAY